MSQINLLVERLLKDMLHFLFMEEGENRQLGIIFVIVSDKGSERESLYKLHPLISTILYLFSFVFPCSVMILSVKPGM